MKKGFISILFMLLLSLFSFTCVHAGSEYYHNGVPSTTNKSYTKTFNDIEVTGMRNICGEHEIYIGTFPTKTVSGFLRLAQIGSENGEEKTYISGHLGVDGSLNLKRVYDGKGVGATQAIGVFEKDTWHTIKWNADFTTGKILVEMYREDEFVGSAEMELMLDGENAITAEDVVYLYGIKVNIASGAKVELGEQKVYSKTLEVTQKNFEASKKVKNDFIPELTFDMPIDAESISEIVLTDSDGNEVACEIKTDAENKVVVIPKCGLEYSSEYELEIPGTVKSADGIYAKQVKYNIVTEENPAEHKLYVDGGKVYFYEKNPSPHEYQRFILINTLDENGIITKSEKKAVTVPADDEVSEEFSVEGTATAELYDEFVGMNYSGYSEIGLTNGIIDRSFSEEHHLYKVTLERDAEMPEITIDGMEKSVKDNVISLSDGTESYRFVVSYENEAPVCSEPTFESDTKLTLNAEAEGKTKILVLPPKSMGEEEAYAISEFLTDDSIMADVKCFDNENIEYVFSEDNMSGSYNFYVVYEGSDEIAGPYSVYYASQTDLDNCQNEWISLKNSSETTHEQVDAYIKKYANILGIDISEYDNMNTKSVADYILTNSEATKDSFCATFKEAVLVVGFNEAANKAEFILTHSEQAGVNVTEDWVNKANTILNTLKAEKPADIERFVSYSNAIILINSSEPSNVISNTKDNAEALELSEAQIAKLGNSSYKSALVNALTSKGFTSSSQIKDAIDGVKVNNDTSSKKPSKGSGGGGGNSVISYIEPNKDNKEDNKDESGGETSGTTDTEKVEVFSDISDVSWAKEAIEYLYNKKIISGSGDGTYRPKDNIKREEFVKILIEALGIEHREESDVFEDASLGKWYTPYIYAAYKNGIVSGITSTEFGVGVDISRQDIAVMIDRALAEMELTVSDIREAQSFSDEGQISSYAFDSVTSLYKKGIFSGNENNEFSPNEKATRAEVAQVIYNLINRINVGEEETK